MANDCHTCPCTRATAAEFSGPFLRKWCTYQPLRYQVATDTHDPCLDCDCEWHEECNQRDGKCALFSGHCLIAGQCHAAGEQRPLEQCFECQPESSTSDWTPVPGRGCDDGDACTRHDACSGLGLCQGEPFADECDTRCHVCDGSGCVLQSGYAGCDADGQCGCSIERHVLSRWRTEA